MRGRPGASPLVVALVLPCAAALAVPSARAVTAAVPAYSVSTTAASVRVVSTQRPAFSVATDDLVDQALGLVSSELSSSSSQARAASYYPGDLVAQAGQLVCGQFGPCPFTPPPYPLLAEASWPTVDHATAGRGAAASSASASASSNSAAAGRSVLPSGALSVGSASSSTSTEVGADGLHVHVAASVEDVALGPLVIRSVRATDDVLVRPDGTRSASPRVVAAGVLVAGRPVQVTETPLPALVRLGLSVRLVGTESSGARTGATGLRIDLVRPVTGVGAPVPGVPTLDRTYLGSVVLGQVSVVASRDDSFPLPAAPAALSSPPSSPPGEEPTVAVPVTVPASPGPSAAEVARPQAQVVVTRSYPGLDDVDLADLYAVLALSAVAGLVVSRALSRRAWSGPAA